MRSTDYPDSAAKHAARERARRFGAVVSHLATEAGYDLTSGTGGRAELAREIGMSPSAVSRMVDGTTLPMPHQMEAIARAVHTDVRTLLVAAEVISADAWPKSVEPDVLSTASPSAPLSPEVAADIWGITEPGLRAMLIGNIRQAIRLQKEVDQRHDQGEAVGRR